MIKGIVLFAVCLTVILSACSSPTSPVVKPTPKPSHVDYTKIDTNVVCEFKGGIGYDSVGIFIDLSIVSRNNIRARPVVAADGYGTSLTVSLYDSVDVIYPVMIHKYNNADWADMFKSDVVENNNEYVYRIYFDYDVEVLRATVKGFMLCEFVLQDDYGKRYPMKERVPYKFK